MRLTKREKLDLARFGCTFQSSQNLLCIKWDASREQTLAAAILARTISAKCSTGPLFCLALEISPTHALAHYCYFPFNLKIRGHRNYLSSLAQTGRLQLCFLAPGRKILRDYQLTSSQCRLMNELYAQALQALKICEPAYRFADAVAEFENTARVSQFFERAMSDSDLTKMLESLKAEAEKVPPEKRALAHQVVRGLVDVVKNRYGDYIRKQIETLPSQRAGLLLLSDLQREFGNDYDRIVEFFADGIAVNAEEEALRKTRDWPQKLESLFKLFDRFSSAPEEEQEKVRSDLMEALGRALSYLQSGRGPSLSMLQDLLLPLRPLLTGQAGRPPKDYSREYEWKVSGLSWTQVTRRSLQENLELRAEFGGREFDSLTFEEREGLTNRIRQGVKSYAERVGKPFPLG